MSQATDEMYARRTMTTAWNTPCWAPEDNASGGVTPAEGEFLYALVTERQPETILEVGTSYGWSGIHLAEGLRDNGHGHLHTVEINAERQEAARSNFALANLDAWVSFYGQIPELGRVDLAFLDAGHTETDIRQYMEAFSWACHESTVIVIHDAKFQGHVLEAIRGTDWQAEILDTDSAEGMAILRKAGK